eukprot:gene8253-10141_t
MKITNILTIGILVIAVGYAQLTSENGRVVFDNWANAYRPVQPTTQLLAARDMSNFDQRRINVGDYNYARRSGAYKKGFNKYSDLSYSNFSNGHLGGNVAGLSVINGTDTYTRRGGGISNGALAGILVGSIVGGLLILAGIIAAFFAWRHHRKRKDNTLYADYRTNYRVDREENAIRDPPREYYREAHRASLNEGYGEDVAASERYREDHMGRYPSHGGYYQSSGTDRANLVRPTESYRH